MSRSLLAALVTLLVLAGCGGAPSGTNRGDAAGEPAGSPDASKTGPEPGGPGLEVQPPVDGPLEDRRTGPVPLRGAGGCAEEYAADAVGTRGFAFDGTVTGIGDSGVTFEVHEWFVGDDITATITLRMAGPTRSRMSESAPSYFVGTRLLVSGEDDTAWACGFTRYYDEETAATWRA